MSARKKRVERSPDNRLLVSGASKISQNAVIDFAVVGAGVAGVYVAWRLLNAGTESVRKMLGGRTAQPAVHLYEATGRVGGRLLTVPMPKIPYLAELGGMRYTPNQLLLCNVIGQLGLHPKPFKFDMSLFYLRGCHFKPQGIPPYQLGPAERGKSPDELIGQAIKCALAEVELPAGRGTEMEYLKKRLSALRDEVTVLDRSYLRAKQWVILQRNGTLKGDTLYNIGFWNLLQYYLSSEAFLLAHDGLGYESVL